ncbi:MAG: TrkA C-terminal domain-containing protein [Microthrixaceae bacterium]
MDDRPRSLRTMLAEAKDTSEIMVDLAYAAVYFNDPGMATEVAELEERMNDLVHDMRAVCTMAVRRPAEAEGMASVLQIISAIESIANAAVDITRIVTHRLGIPHELIGDLSNAEEVSHRVWIREGSHMAHRPLKDLEITVQCGMRVVAIRRERSWMIEEVDGDLVLLPGDVLFLRGSPAGIARLHELAAAPSWDPPPVPDSRVLSDLDRAVDVLVEMKNISETAVGLAYSALALRDSGLAAEVRHLSERLDEMKDHLQLWVLRAAQDDVDLSALRGLLQLASAAAELGDQANQMVWLITDDRRFHPIVKLALGEADVVATQIPVAAGSVAAGRSLAELQLDIEPGFHVLAIRRDNRYLYRPRGSALLHPGDSLIASGPQEGRVRLAELCGWNVIEDEDDPSGEFELVPLAASR